MVLHTFCAGKQQISNVCMWTMLSIIVSKKLLVNTVADHWPRPLPSAHKTPQRPGPIYERPPVKCGSADADVERGIKCGEICGYYVRMLWVG